jgi:RimJ/RimL family protein N-acetyltransferase
MRRTHAVPYTPTDMALNIPESFETERLLIRAPRPDDGIPMREAMAETLADLKPWMPWARSVPTPVESEENVLEARKRFLDRSDMRLHLFLKDTGEFVGGSGLHRIDWSVPKFEIGYWCRKRCQGRGLITEAVRGITRFAFETLGANRVEIRCDIANERSRAVAEKAGFVLEAALRNERRRLDNTLSDTLVFAMTTDDWHKHG